MQRASEDTTAQECKLQGHATAAISMPQSLMLDNFVSQDGIRTAGHTINSYTQSTSIQLVL